MARYAEAVASVSSDTAVQTLKQAAGKIKSSDKVPPPNEVFTALRAVQKAGLKVSATSKSTHPHIRGAMMSLQTGFVSFHAFCLMQDALTSQHSMPSR